MPNRPLTLNSLIIMAFLSFSAWTLPAKAADGPTAPVEAFHDALIATMKDAETTTIKDRYRRLEPVIGTTFHMNQIIRLIIGDFWTKADSAQRERLVKAFTHMGISRLITLFDGYSGETFETLEQRNGSSGTRLVLTRLNLPSKKPVGITYITREIEGRWYIIDALLDDNISELSVRRSEYHRVLVDNGVDGLIDVLNRKAEELLGG